MNGKIAPLRIDLTSRSAKDIAFDASRLETTGWVAYPGQQIEILVYEQKNQKYMWQLDVSGCKDAPVKTARNATKATINNVTNTIMSNPQYRHHYPEMLTQKSSKWTDVSFVDSSVIV